MGLTAHSTGVRAADTGLVIEKKSPSDSIVALAGNPNVGKSTLFNFLTGMNQHTGNWPGKTVSNAQGRHRYNGREYILVDLPGTYSLLAHSAEEEVARDFICFGGADATIVVCDATCLERNLNLVLQTIEITPHVVVCVNLMDEARKKGIALDLDLLEKRLGVPVVGTSARSGRGLHTAIERLCTCEETTREQTVHIRYIQAIEQAIALVEPAAQQLAAGRVDSRWLALRLIDYDESLSRSAANLLGVDFMRDAQLQIALSQARRLLKEAQISAEKLRDCIVSCIILSAEELCDGVVSFHNRGHNQFDRRLDRLLTGRYTGIPVMLLLLGGIFWLTITGANYPSALLSSLLFSVQDWLSSLFFALGAPIWLEGALVQGVYRVLAWVVSVMLPPMAIFFPLFTLLEDFGYLPRIAFNLDHHFKKACACGKQALTMCLQKSMLYGAFCAGGRGGKQKKAPSKPVPASRVLCDGITRKYSSSLETVFLCEIFNVCLEFFTVFRLLQHFDSKVCNRYNQRGRAVFHFKGNLTGQAKGNFIKIVGRKMQN